MADVNTSARILELLRDPEQQAGITVEVFTTGERGEVVDGRLLSGNSKWFRIENSIVNLLPKGLRDHDRHRAFAARYGLAVEACGDRGLAAKLASDQKQIDFSGRILRFTTMMSAICPSTVSSTQCTCIRRGSLMCR